MLSTITLNARMNGAYLNTVYQQKECQICLRTLVSCVINKPELSVNSSKVCERDSVYTLRRDVHYTLQCRNRMV